MSERLRICFVCTLLLASTAMARTIDITSSSGSSSGIGDAPPSEGPGTVLYDQMDNPAGASANVTSQDFEAAFDGFDDQAADDFVVPTGGWTITSVEVDGAYGGGPGPAASFHVFFYANAAGLPGALAASRIAQPFTGTLGDAAITLTPAVVLSAGTYWVSVQAREDFTTAGQWFWGNRSVTSNSLAAWQNPTGGWSTPCTSWGVKTMCLPSQVGADQLFRLNGTVNLVAWTNEAPIALDAYGSPTTAAAGALYSGGGYSFSLGADTQNFQRWNPDTNVWTPLAPLPDLLGSLGSMVYGHNGKIYLFGGEVSVSGVTTDATRIYDIATNTWSSGAVMPAVRAFMGAGYFDGAIYLAGGYNNGQVTSAQTTLWRYNIAGNSFTVLAPVPAALGGSGSAVIDGVLYLAGGRDASNTVIASLYGYDILANSWATLASLPSPNNVPGAAVVSGELWVYGGGNPFFTSDDAADVSAVPETAATCTAYDPVANAWGACPTLLNQRAFTGGAAVRNIPVAVGGYNGSTTVTTVEANRSAPGTLPVGAGRQLIVDATVLGYAPNNFQGEALNIAEYAFVTSRPAANDFALFQTHDPWGGTTVKDAITRIGRTFTVFAPPALAGFPFASYRAVVLNWDDHFVTDFNTAYAAAIPALEAYVRGGGVLWIQGAIQGTGGETFALPFGGTMHWGLHAVNVIVDPASPLVTALVSPINGNYASHAFADGYPAAAHLVQRFDDPTGGVTLYDFTPLVFIDGFESANTSRWSLTVP